MVSFITNQLMPSQSVSNFLCWQLLLSLYCLFYWPSISEAKRYILLTLVQFTSKLIDAVKVMCLHFALGIAK